METLGCAPVQVVQTAGQAADPMAAYRPAAAALGASLIAGAVSNALLSTLTAWTAERFAARLKSRLFAKIMSSNQARKQSLGATLAIAPSPIYHTQMPNGCSLLCPSFAPWHAVLSFQGMLASTSAPRSVMMVL